MADKQITAAALASGFKQAARVLEMRAAARTKREKALQTYARKAGKKGLQARIDEGAAAQAFAFPSLFGKAVSAGILLAEGDSWFDYPIHHL